MGFLTDGDTLDWEDAKKVRDYIKEHGIIQFLAIWKKLKDRENDILLWGDEIEYIILHFDEEKKKVTVSLRGFDIVHELDTLTENDPEWKALFAWRPEYGTHMIEGTPGKPFNCKDFALVESNMKLRRKAIKSQLRENEDVITLTNFPLFGVGQFTTPAHLPNGPIAMSLFTPDEIINPHKRFGTLTANIRKRRGSKVVIQSPLYMDKNTKPLLFDELRSQGVPVKDNHIYMDSMAFGMGQCCLQCTFQCVNVEEARNFYDQLAVLCPIMLALTAADPVLRGYLADTDVRWHIISQSVDDRTQEEMGVVPLQNDKYVLKKSRYGPIDCYISNHVNPKFNDVPVIYDQAYYKTLLDADIDEVMAKHIAHLFVRDPLVVYNDKVEIDDETHVDHFENIQSSVWQTVRFKPPPPNSPIGWRVEFRPMEVQLTDFENAAFACFVVLFTRALSTFDMNLYIPISKMEENMEKALLRDAVHTQKFYFRKNITNKMNASEGLSLCSTPMYSPGKTHNEEYAEMTINEIMNGSEELGFTGLIPLVKAYLDKVNLDWETRCVLNRYMKLISQRASGQLQTMATWMRDFITKHPDYKQDSVVSESINYDLIKTCLKIVNHEEVELAKPLLGDLYSDSVNDNNNNTNKPSN
jgi:glutamate--cysteine ligase catalytic subunit